MKPEQIRAQIGLWQRVKKAAERGDTQSVNRLLGADAHLYPSLELVVKQAEMEIDYHQTWLDDIQGV